MTMSRTSGIDQGTCIDRGEMCSIQCRAIRELDSVGFYSEGYQGQPAYDPSTEPAFINPSPDFEQVDKARLLNDLSAEERVDIEVSEALRRRMPRARHLGCISIEEVSVWIETRVREGKKK